MAFILHGVLQMFGFGSGVIKGKGKGTDDAVKMGLQKGAYVMPADSTEQIGAEQLGALGKGFVPAHVSNGEFHLPPEQVHGLGVQVLDAMKNATHKPVPDKQGLGFGVYLANGGVVDDEQNRAYALGKRVGNAYASAGGSGGMLSGSGGAMVGMQPVAKDASMAFHRDNERLKHGLAKAGRAIGDFAKGLAGEDAYSEPIGFDAPNHPAQKPTPTNQASGTFKVQSNQDNAARGAMPAVTMSQQELYPRDYLGQVRAMSDASPSSKPQPKGYLVGDSKGISFAPTPVNQGFGGAGVGNAPKEQPFVATIGETPDPRKSAAWKAASTPHAGAQNRQLTANQINAMRGMLADDDRNQVALQQTAMNNAAQSANAQANNQAALQREAMQQQGALMRDGINQASQDRRLSMQQAQQQGQFDVANAFNERKQANQEQLDAIKIEQAKRLQNLQNALLSAQSDADKSAIAKQIAMLNGEFKSSNGFNPDQYTKLKRTMMGEDGMPIENEDIVDLKTGKSILAGSQPSLQAGVVIDGYRFKGGNPNDTKNWEKA